MRCRACIYILLLTRIPKHHWSAPQHLNTSTPFIYFYIHHGWPLQTGLSLKKKPDMYFVRWRYNAFLNNIWLGYCLFDSYPTCLLGFWCHNSYVTIRFLCGTAAFHFPFSLQDQQNFKSTYGAPNNKSPEHYIPPESLQGGKDKATKPWALPPRTSCSLDNCTFTTTETQPKQTLMDS